MSTSRYSETWPRNTSRDPLGEQCQANHNYWNISFMIVIMSSHCFFFHYLQLGVGWRRPEFWVWAELGRGWIWLPSKSENIFSIILMKKNVSVSVFPLVYTYNIVGSCDHQLSKKDLLSAARSFQSARHRGVHPWAGGSERTDHSLQEEHTPHHSGYWALGWKGWRGI